MNPIKTLRPFAVAMVVLGASGCAQHFTRVDFKYDSNAHLRPRDTQLELNATPAAVVAKVAQFAKDNGGVITAQGPDRPPLRIEFPSDAEEIWQAARTIFEAEWRSFEKDDPKSYFAIDRKAPLANRPRLAVKNDGVTESASIRIEFPPREGKHSVTVSGGPLIPIWFTRVFTVEITPVVYVFAWRTPSGATRVYARGTPKIQKTEAGAPGAWCRYQLWTASTGYQEAELVRQILDALAATRS